MINLERIVAAVRAVCPGANVRIGKRALRETWQVVPHPDVPVTPEQIAAGQAVLSAFDDSDAAWAAWEADQQPERKGLRAAAAQTIADNNTFLALASPTNAQVLAQVKSLTQQNNRIIKRIIQID